MGTVDSASQHEGHGVTVAACRDGASGGADGTAPQAPVRHRLKTAGGVLLAWLAATVAVGAVLFVHGSASTTVAGHSATVSPTLDGYATFDLGPHLPAVRYPTENTLGAQVDLGAIRESTYRALVARYSSLAAQPDGQIAKIRATLLELGSDSLLSGALLATTVPGLWWLLGRRRRAELRRHRGRLAVVGAAAAVLLAAAIGQPWQWLRPSFQERPTWQPLEQALPGVTVPAEAALLQVQAGLMTRGTHRLVESAVGTYSRSVEFYRQLAADAQALESQLRQPAAGETVGLLVSDRHDNVGMDRVARAVADAADATMLFDAGDDTSTGGSWEAFSLDSLHAAFGDLEYKFTVAGNHDHGDFVADYLDNLGFDDLDGRISDGPDGLRVVGVGDPRRSGLGSWRDEPGMTFAEHEHAVADMVCGYDADAQRAGVLLVHDANTGRESLARGCVDLVLGGHLHVQQGPEQVVGVNGRTGYSFTNGTTGGAAYALALGSKLRREAQVTLVTFSGGRPAGLQPVTISTTGEFEVAPYQPLRLS